MTMDYPDSSGRDMSEFPSLPSGYAIIFRCRDCEYRWRIEVELPALVEIFYEQNKKCYGCKNTNIEMDILPIASED